ncbi:hypothetical protein B484DRAFT_322662 [Ochromonadaceae sp. CCMP2298]|nr:hypothetical protein B484DRAFT_322662 [Ochromonadaceae sp. CCMP2298]
MFVKQQGRRHAINGLLYFAWLGIGFLNLWHQIVNYLLFDVVLGVLGTALPLSAAMDHQHRNVRNSASGTLDEHATVTHSEMIEHSFYQGLNLLQVVYFHLIPLVDSWAWRVCCLVAVTSPWLARSQYPINRFSDNYNTIDARSSALIRVLYRTKKYQYVFYKHFLLHGLNLSVAVGALSLPTRFDFRLYWILLNTSYVMEFFLQTLVKKRYMMQTTMLRLQVLLMLASTIAALYVLVHVNILLALVSLLLNFANRGYDFANTMIVLTLYLLYTRYLRP